MSDGPDPQGPGGRHDRHRRRWWIVLGALAVTLVGLGVAFAVVLDRQPERASIDEAVEDFAGGGDHGDGTSGALRPPPEGVYV